MSVSIRLAEREDLPGLLLLLPQLSSRAASDAAQMPPMNQARGIFDDLLKRDGVAVFVAVAEQLQAVIGCLTLVVVPNLTYGGRPWAIVENVVVDERHRRKGVGRRLVLHAIERAEQEGCYKIQLLSGGRNDQVAFYRRLGFESSSWVGHKRYSESVAERVFVR